MTMPDPNPSPSPSPSTSLNPHDPIPMGADLIAESAHELQAYLLHLEGWVREIAKKVGVEEPINPTLKKTTAGWGNGKPVE